MTKPIESWGRYPKLQPAEVRRLLWREEIPDLSKFETNVLAIGYAKSYGDSCLNEGGILLDCKGLNKFIDFDPATGRIRVEAGVTLADILDFAVPRGFFLASTPGTKHISVGGALANDVHGKNHHKGGTFGCHVNCFELMRSNGERFICSREENPELFAATIGGLGLTGLILWVDFNLKPCPSAFFDMEAIQFDDLEEFFVINEESEKLSDYTVAWVDTTADGPRLGRGIYNRGNHADPKDFVIPDLPKDGALPFPIDYPFINFHTVRAFNQLYFNKQLEKKQRQLVHYNPFFYPLDAVNDWNKAYGPKGFLQYQFVIPFGDELFTIRKILKFITESGLSSFLTVLKTFGDVKSPGMLSFPRPGVTMAVDFRMTGEKTLNKMFELDKIVKDAGGILYPAKDARMTGKDFRLFYPQWEEFAKYIDPKFSSSFMRRVTSYKD